MASFRSILTDGGVIFGDDYVRSDLIEAVDDYAAEAAVPVTVASDRRTWILHFSSPDSSSILPRRF
ncbi:unnamed protein product [Gongylonema pulchrum]|uniref:Uncharacterized protein n=1 Tax=Gongylonema pulchrum TaxID=637853 RepID=A0A3P6PV29_9BILA|nr:unnamed protein product [Gongylonema pulchrum]